MQRNSFLFRPDKRNAHPVLHGHLIHSNTAIHAYAGRGHFVNGCRRQFYPGKILPARVGPCPPTYSLNRVIALRNQDFDIGGGQTTGACHDADNLGPPSRRPHPNAAWVASTGAKGDKSNRPGKKISCTTHWVPIVATERGGQRRRQIDSRGGKKMLADAFWIRQLGELTLSSTDRNIPSWVRVGGSGTFAPQGIFKLLGRNASAMLSGWLRLYSI